ncbi:uncharacterized protein PG986_006455 [Apiospora aurea]|uniref:Uncharacterized protein n=1 Tax=Apiospora aurea TaxID=335848 RepID=A0ABR1QKH1_9PEZI
MGSSATGLGVYITLNKIKGQRVHVDFRTPDQAEAYMSRLRQTSLVQREDLEPEKSHQTEVSLRLPSRVSGIVTSTTYGGFYLMFTDTVLAREWAKSLLIWKSVPDHKCWLYVDRFILNNELSRKLDLDQGPSVRASLVTQQTSGGLPGQAKHSESLDPPAKFRFRR